MGERVYSEKEASVILETAARRQGVGEPEVSVGLTLSELEGVAAAAGIERRHVAAAAAELAGHAAPARGTIVGLQAEATRTLLLDHPVSDEEWGRVVADLRRTFGAVGVTSDVGAVRAWASAASENEVPVVASLEPEGAGARLTLTQRPGDIVAVLTMIVVGVLAVLGAATALFDADGRGLGLFILAAGLAVYAGVRTWYGRSIRRLEVQFEDSLRRVASLLAAPAPAPLAGGSEKPTTELDPQSGEPAASRTIGSRTRS